MRRATVFITTAVLLSTLVACSGAMEGFTDLISTAEEGPVTAATAPSTSDEVSNAAGVSVGFDAEDLDASVVSAGTTTIDLQGDSIRVEGAGATLNGSVVTITAAGTYVVQGTLDDGQIIVNTQDQETVRLILNGADISCLTSAPIYIVNAEKTVITLADGTHNSVTDGADYALEGSGSGEPDAAVFSNDDLTINGGGSLTLVGNYKHGIASDDDLRIAGGIITIAAANDGLRGRDSLAVRDGTIIVNAGSDALRASNDEEADKGIVSIEGGVLDLTAGADGIQAETSLLVSGGEIRIVAGGGSGEAVAVQEAWGPGGMGNPAVSEDTGDSARGLQAGVSLEVTGGTLEVDAADDALHSNESLTTTGGIITLASGDDGIHAETSLEINGGELSITQSYEGIESQAIVVNGGTIHVVSSDDGFNATGGGGGFDGGPVPFGGFAGTGDYTLDINGGTIVVDAGGDGFDINGPITMTSGLVIIHGPTNDGNGPVDYSGEFAVSGGYLVAAGSAGMAQAPSTNSTQNSIILVFESPLSAGTMIHIETAEGDEVLTFLPTKAYQSVVLSTSDLSQGTSYVVYTGGTSTGAATDGLYVGGSYAPGFESTSFTVSGTVTSVGWHGGGSGGGRGGPGGQRP